ncbi:hypothetical protein GCM10010392_59750 [Streptomyces clavifer]|nr:hypothetical protein GCM10010392_59750 [Streptomyces clavifer]
MTSAPAAAVRRPGRRAVPFLAARASKRTGCVVCAPRTGHTEARPARVTPRRVPAFRPRAADLGTRTVRDLRHRPKGATTLPRAPEGRPNPS